MLRVYTVVLLFLLYFSQVFAEVIKFAPLPLKPKDELIGEYLPLVDYLREKTGLDIQLVYIDSYDKLIREFSRGSIHITTLGPMPYVKLVQVYGDAVAVAYFKEKDGSNSYRCVLITTPDGPDSVKSIKGPVALPQKLSTCAEFSLGVILSKHSMEIKKFKLKNFADHMQAVEAVLRGEFEAAVVREDIAKQYTGFGIKVLDRSPSWPSISVVVNTKLLSPEKVESIKRALLFASWKDLRRLIAGRYGFSEVKKEDYEEVFRYKKFIPD